MKKKTIVADVMLTPAVTTTKEITLDKIYAFFEKEEMSHLIVTEQSKIIGVISDRDVLNALSKSGTDVHKTTAEQIMSSNPICIEEQSSIYKSIQMMIDNRISCLPVLDKSDKLCGVVSLKMLLTQFMEQLKGLEHQGSVDFRFL